MNNQKTILIVDDEERILEVNQAYLEKEGYHVITAQNGVEALKCFESQAIHLIILDLMMPYMSGEIVCRKIRETSQVPIIMLSAKNYENDKINGLVLGADDYVTKPFSAKELVLRVKAIIKRTYKEEIIGSELWCFNNGQLIIDKKNYSVELHSVALNVTPNEFALLSFMAEYPGQVFSREQLIEGALGMTFNGFDRTVDVHIKNLRKKMDIEGAEMQWIITVFGVGYKFGGKKCDR